MSAIDPQAVEASRSGEFEWLIGKMTTDLVEHGNLQPDTVELERDVVRQNIERPELARALEHEARQRAGVSQ